MKSKILTLLVLFVCYSITYSQNNEVAITINLIENENIADVNVDQEKFIESIGLIVDYCKNNFKDLPTTQKIGILAIVHKQGNPTYKCFLNPDNNDSLKTKILSDLNELKIENTKLVDFPLFISINTEKTSDFKDYIDPVKQKITEYKNADLATKLRLNKEYAINEVLPVLTAYEVNTEAKFEGVVNFGKLIEKTNFNEIQNIDELTSKNKNYWRAVMEMSAGNQLIPITKIFALVSQGELDYAKKYIEIIRIFTDPQTISNKYLEEINSRINLFNEDLYKKIQRGIEEHDEGEYQRAINIYNEILSVYPNSSWTLYEKYYSENTKKIAYETINSSDREDWDKAKIEIYKHNPLYHMDIRASNGQEAYLLFRRQEINNLFEKKENLLKDVFEYADIASDLGVHDFAAQLFWLTAIFDKKNAKKSLNYYLYCLDKLGETELKYNFNIDYDKVFKKIEKDKEKKMLKSSIYKKMNKKQ